MGIVIICVIFGVISRLRIWISGEGAYYITSLPPQTLTNALYREAYTAFFNHLDATGGFYYERWGDAPVHSIAASLFLQKDQIHFFEEIGYEHIPYTHCPRNEGVWKKGRCACDPGSSFDYDGYSCMRQWDRVMPSGS